SRSTKLVHGGVRYLQQGNIKLVMDALRERGIMKKNAPHLVKNQSFIVPNYKWWEGPYYGLGLKVYDWMSGSLGLGTSEWLSTEEVLERAPTLDPEGLRGGVVYHDGQFDDSRLALNLAQTAIEHGALAINYFGVNAFIKAGDTIAGVMAEDMLNNKTYEIKAKVVVNATGVFSDAIQQMDEPGKESTITPSQGIHIVLDIIVGTTDTLVDDILTEPLAREEEINFLVQHAARYLTKDPSVKDIRSIYSGLRPLVKNSAKKTAEISRDHSIIVSDSGLVSIVGGKWTTYRKMAEDTVNTAAVQARLPYKDCVTTDLRIHGGEETEQPTGSNYYYGSDISRIETMMTEDASYRSPIHERLPYRKGEIIWAVRNELCMTVEDALSRRTRALLLDAVAAVEASVQVAEWMATELNKDQEWIIAQVKAFNDIARSYLPK
ncbi:MAG: glycerol-3-phosphate dehydrogenase/oxidase, partial [Sphingobacteriales bacterium]